MTPTTPRESRNASSSSPITTIFFGGPSASGSSLDKSTGIQNRRNNSPIGVPEPLSVRNLLSSARSIACPPGFCLLLWQSLAQAKRGVNAAVELSERPGVASIAVVIPAHAGMPGAHTGSPAFADDEG